MGAPINGWTKAQIIQAIRQGNNGKRSIGGQPNDEYCVYRSSDGNKCAVGCFIPDDLYYPSANICSVGTLLKQYPGLTSFMPLSYIDLYNLQRVHDRCLYGDVREALIKWIEENVFDSPLTPAE